MRRVGLLCHRVGMAVVCLTRELNCGARSGARLWPPRMRQKMQSSIWLPTDVTRCRLTSKLTCSRSAQYAARHLGGTSISIGGQARSLRLSRLSAAGIR